MNKTLVVSFLPSGEQSITKKVLSRFLGAAEGKTQVIHRDLITQHPPIFNETSMTAYKLRGFAGQTLEGALKDSLKPFDALMDEIKGVNQVVFAFPMHNFAVPGIVKSYIDAISQYGVTVKMEGQTPVGQLGALKAAVIYASGGQYEEGSPRNTVPAVFNIDLDQIGIKDITYINAGATLYGDEAVAKTLEVSGKAAEDLARKWFA